MRSRNFAVFFSLLVLIVSACSAPAEPTPTQAIAETATSAATLEPSATPEAEQTPTTAPLQLEVVESYQYQAYYTNGDPIAQYIDAVVRNPFDFAVDITGLPTALLFNSAGESVLRTQGVIIYEGSFIGLEQIMPGESIGIAICACNGRTTVEFETWQLDFDIQEIAPIRVSTDFDISLDGFAFADQFGEASIHGALRYTGDQPLRGIIVRIFLRDADGKFVAAGQLALRGDRIQGGYANIEPGATFDLFHGVSVDAALKGQNLIPEVSAIGIIAE